MSEGIDQHHARDRDSAQRFADQHRMSRVPPIDKRARGKVEEDAGGSGREAGQASGYRRAGERKDKQRVANG